MIVDDDLGIGLSDGTRLSAKIWRPESSDKEPVPAILEYLPYRKSDGTAERDDTMHPWFAAHGFACLRVDRRGCGESEGLFDDEYSEQELSDGVEIVNWIAAQPWCSGAVGMQGISWGGFNGVQIAARAPEALKAVISIGTTVDRFRDDIHYKGGLQLSENIGWAATATSWLSMPPDPGIVGESWRDMWLTRLRNMPFVARRWTEHSDRSDYWKHGSICEDYGAIKAPVLVMGGLHDGYRNAMAAMVENLTCPVQGVTGPWSHKYPHISTISPAIDYLNTALRWWDRWLKGINNGAEQDPKMRVYVMDSIPPDDHLSHRPGRWIAEAHWPSPEVHDVRFALSDAGLGPDGPLSRLIHANLLCGEAAGEFFPYGFGSGELPGDQQVDDARALCFDSAALEDETILLGAPRINLTLSSSAPQAQIVARLCDVHPDGKSTLITMGLLNLRHRNGFVRKQDLVPNEVYHIAITLDQSAYTIPKGHVLRLALSSSYWPYCWPESELAELHVTGGALNLPVRSSNSLVSCAFDPPLEHHSDRFKNLRAGTSSKTWRAEADGSRVLTIIADHGRQIDTRSGLICESHLREEWSILPVDPAKTKARIEWQRALGRGEWGVETTLICEMSGTRTHFEIEQTMTATEGDEVVFNHHERASVPR